MSHYPIFPSLPLCTVCCFFSWVRVTSLTHFNQPNWYSSFAVDEAIRWLVCCAPWSLNGGGWLPWGKGLWPGIFFCVCAAPSTCQHCCSWMRAPAGCGAALLELLVREAVQQEGFLWLYIFFQFNCCLPLVLTCLGSEITWGAEQTHNFVWSCVKRAR